MARRCLRRESPVSFFGVLVLLLLICAISLKGETIEQVEIRRIDFSTATSKIVSGANGSETSKPTGSPSHHPTFTSPSSVPSTTPSAKPSTEPSFAPTTSSPSSVPSTQAPSFQPTESPSVTPSQTPSKSPTTSQPSATPSKSSVTSQPSAAPSKSPATSQPSGTPTQTPSTRSPSYAPSRSPINSPSKAPSFQPSTAPSTPQPTFSPSKTPMVQPTLSPSLQPTLSPKTSLPSSVPTYSPAIAVSGPNVVILLVDDLDYADVGYNGGYALTPRLNALVASPHAINLERLYSPSAVCSPTRLSLLTGRAPERDCILGALLDDTGYKFRQNVTSVASLAREVGYRTAFFGKWHLNKTPGYLGYDYWVYTPSNVPTYDPACFCMERSCQDSCKFSRKLCIKASFRKCSSKTTRKQCDMGHMRKTKELGFTNWGCNVRERSSEVSQDSFTVLQFPRAMMASEYNAQRFSQYADEHLKESKQPFWVQISFQDPHRPFIASPEWRQACYNGTSCRDVRATNSIFTNYYGVVSALDSAIGKVIDKLDDIGRLNDTLVLFASDNAGEDLKGVVNLLKHRPFRGTKRLVYEGGIRVPGFIYWPGVIQQNAVITESTTLLDFAPTFLDILKDRNQGKFEDVHLDVVDGQSWFQMIRTPSLWKRTRPIGVCQPITYLMKNVCERYTYIDGPFKIITNRMKAPKTEIYRVDIDRGEKHNLVKNMTLLNSLLPAARSWMSQVYGEYLHNCKKPAAPKKKKKKKAKG